MTIDDSHSGIKKRSPDKALRACPLPVFQPTECSA